MNTIFYILLTCSSDEFCLIVLPPLVLRSSVSVIGPCEQYVFFFCKYIIFFNPNPTQNTHFRRDSGPLVFLWSSPQNFVVELWRVFSATHVYYFCGFVLNCSALIASENPASKILILYIIFEPRMMTLARFQKDFFTSPFVRGQRISLGCLQNSSSRLDIGFFQNKLKSSAGYRLVFKLTFDFEKLPKK